VLRSRLTTVLASLGLAACTRPDASTSEPEPEVSATSFEPSGLGQAAKPAVACLKPSPEPHFEGVPLEFCQATLQRRDDTLVRTQSFLEAWNELAPRIQNRLAHNIPGSEVDARIAVCGSERCTIGSAQIAEVQADYMIGTGVLIPIDSELLVVPAVVEPHNVGPCSNDATADIERHGGFFHVRTISHDRHYSYGHGYAHGYGYGEYEPIPIECLTYATRWRDLIIDADTGELELIIDQSQPEETAPPRIQLEFDTELPGIVLRGCGTVFELVWTE
jgi:hypothetical protein